MSIDCMATDAYRATHNPMTALKRDPARGRASRERIGDCNTCSWTHPDGPCDNPVPRAGIRDLSNPTKPTYSTLRKKGGESYVDNRCSYRCGYAVPLAKAARREGGPSGSPGAAP
jgi:hypothetical protein